jgi:hypothetical protein
LSTKVPVLSRRDVGELYPSLRDQYKYLESRRDPADKKGVAEHLVQTGEVAAGAAGVGLIAGRLGSASLGNTGIPIGLALGALGHAAAFFGVTGRFSDHIHNLSDGAIAGWVALWGAAQGGQMRQQASETGGGTVVAGAPPQATAQPNAAPPQLTQGNVNRFLTEAELQAIAQKRRGL